MMKTLLTTALAVSAFCSASAMAATFTLTSQDIAEGHKMHRSFEYAGFGCQGDNLSPQLSWQNVPEGTKSFAITAYDPDAPTGSGWWHWSVINLPASLASLPRGADMTKLGAREIRNDYGQHAFGGACPPKGHGMHRYQFTVWALPEEKLALDENSSAALVGFMLNSMALGKATLTATYVR